jgi:hypothetical protein
MRMSFSHIQLMFILLGVFSAVMLNLGQTVHTFLYFSAFSLFLVAAKGSFLQNLGFFSTFGLLALFCYFLGFFDLYELVQTRTSQKSLVQGYQYSVIPSASALEIKWLSGSQDEKGLRSLQE